MFKVNSCGTTSLTGLTNLSMTGPTGMVGPLGIKSRVQNYLIAPMEPYIIVNAEPVPVDVDPNPDLFETESTPIILKSTRIEPNPESLVQSTRNFTMPSTSFTNGVVHTPQLSILELTRIKKGMTVLSNLTKPIIRDDIPVGQNQPTKGILKYTLGPLGLPRYDGSNYIEIHIPFQVEFNYQLYNKIYLYGRSYITFGEKYELTSSPGDRYNAEISGFNPPIESIFVGASIGVATNFYYGLENQSSTFRIRYEGYRDLLNNIPLIWEIVFYRNNPSRIDVSAETIDFQGLTGLSSGSGFLATFDLASNSGVTCTPTSMDYKDILLTTRNISTQSSGDTIDINIQPLFPLEFYSQPFESFGFTLKNDVLANYNTDLTITSPYDTSLLSTVFLSLYANTGGDISLIPTFQSTDGPGGYVTITNPNLQPQPSTSSLSNIEIENGYCKLIL